MSYGDGQAKSLFMKNSHAEAVGANYEQAPGCLVGYGMGSRGLSFGNISVVGLSLTAQGYLGEEK